MMDFKIQYKCGHTEILNYKANSKYIKLKLCPKCEQWQTEKTQEAAWCNWNFGQPKLIGSKKEINFAEVLRYDALELFSPQERESFKNKKTAKWWIEMYGNNKEGSGLYKIRNLNCCIDEDEPSEDLSFLD